MTTPSPTPHTDAMSEVTLDNVTLTRILAARAGTRMEPLVGFARALASDKPRDAALVQSTVGALVALLGDCAGNGRQRMEMGEVLGLLGDPRLRRPEDADYWARITFEDGHVLDVGRNMVTATEFRHWLDNGGYEDNAAWSAGGHAWLDSGADRWHTLADDPEVAHLVIPNQPAAGPTWWEAEAYARANGARLLNSAERRFLVRGEDKKPYPWGAPFGDGNANTREEALGRPVAVGIFSADRTEEGITDLAGNMGEWLTDGTEDGRRMLHPGSWARPSMASWAKALEMADPGTRSADLSFRIARPV